MRRHVETILHKSPSRCHTTRHRTTRDIEIVTTQERVIWSYDSTIARYIMLHLRDCVMCKSVWWDVMRSFVRNTFARLRIVKSWLVRRRVVWRDFIFHLNALLGLCNSLMYVKKEVYDVSKNWLRKKYRNYSQSSCLNIHFINFWCIFSNKKGFW